MKMIEILDSLEKWTQGAMGRDKDGVPSLVFAEETCQWCLLAGMLKVSKGRKEFSFDEVYDFVEGKVSGPVSIWNDASGRSFEEIQEVCKEIDEWIERRVREVKDITEFILKADEKD